MKEPSQFQFNCRVSLLAIRDYISKFGISEWSEDLNWTVDRGFVETYVEEQYRAFQKAPFMWFLNVDEETQFKFLAGVENRIRGKYGRG